MRSLSSSPGGSGRGRSNFLQRLSSTLRDRSSRGFKKEEYSSSAEDRAQARFGTLPRLAQGLPAKKCLKPV